MSVVTELKTTAEFDTWISANAALVLAYAEENDVAIRDLPISAREFNTLRLNGIEKISQLVVAIPESVAESSLIGTVVRGLRRDYLRQHKQELIKFVEGKAVAEVKTDSAASELAYVNENCKQAEAGKQLLDMPKKKAEILQYLIARATPIEDLGLSVRSYNALRRAFIDQVHKALALYPDGFVELRNLGKKSVDEICQVLEITAAKIAQEIDGGTDVRMEEPVLLPEDTSIDTVASDFSLMELLEHPAFKEKAKRCLKEVDVPIETMGFGVRAVNALKNASIFTFSAILPIYPDGIPSLRNIGAKTVAEIQEKVSYYLGKLQPIVAAYCGDDTDAMYTDEYIAEKVMGCFDNTGFSGLSFPQMRSALPDAITDQRIKKCIGGLIAEKKLEYVDYRCYRVYPSVFDVLQESLLPEEDKSILRQRMAGITLEAIAAERGVTRERIRQIVNKKLDKLREYAVNAYGVHYFDEDFYTYLYEHYDVEKELWFEYLGVSERTFGYLVNTYSRGRVKIESALSDPDVNLILKFKIREYLNRNKIMIDGMLIDAQRAAIEDYALAKLCRDEMSYDEFVDLYNNLLRENGVAFSEKLYNTDEVRRTRTNRWAESRLCLWKQGERLRFYNIDAQDYTELLETLNLEGFQDTEISTLKFFNDYPDVMEKYDIRDQYELHNLLKKIVDSTTCHDISFNRQPMIRFGEFDREKAIYEIIEAFSPITADDLAEYVHSEYGYTKEIAMAGYFQPFMHYYHQGVFSVTFKRIPDERITMLLENLPGEFYYIAEIKEVYKKLFPGADEEEINHRSLKGIGYTVLGKYALRGYDTAEEFFKAVLLRDDVFSITPLNKRYGSIQMYQQVLLETKRNMDILLFDGDQYIQFRKLAKMGITKEYLMNYCRQVYDAVKDESYFTPRAIREAVPSKLDDFGFDDLFYGALLSASGLFIYVRGCGTFILYKGNNAQFVSKDAFFISLLHAYESVELSDFIDDCSEQYGVTITDRYDVTRAIAGTEFYYDSIMGKIYRNKSYYYSEFDE